MRPVPVPVAAEKSIPFVRFWKTRSGPGLRDVAFWAATATAVITPLFVSKYSSDMFAAPKELVLRLGGIIVLALLLLRLVFEPKAMLADLRARRWTTILAAAAIGWTAVAAAVSTNGVLSSWTLLRVILCAAIAVAAVLGVARQRFETIYVLLAPAIINTVILIAQDLLVWDPIYPRHMWPVRSALLGNSNWAGTYLLVWALAAVALIYSMRTRRLLHVAIAVLLCIGVIISQSLASIGALTVGIVVMGAMYSWRRAAVACVILAVALGAVVLFYEPVQTRALRVQAAIADGNLNMVASSRLTAYAAAYEMFRDRPLTGIGPGCYELQYFAYKIRAEVSYPILQRSDDRPINFGEAHNDHLETLAIAGIPGYAILAGVLIFVGRRSRLGRNRQDSTPRQAFTYAFSLPLVVATSVVMLAQFPLALAASTVTLLFAAAFCVGWSGDAESA